MVCQETGILNSIHEYKCIKQATDDVEGVNKGRFKPKRKSCHGIQLMLNSIEWQWRVKETLLSRSCWKTNNASLKSTVFTAHYPPTHSP